MGEERRGNRYRVGIANTSPKVKERNDGTALLIVMYISTVSIAGEAVSREGNHLFGTHVQSNQS